MSQPIGRFRNFPTCELFAQQTRGAFPECDEYHPRDGSVQTVRKRQVTGTIAKLIFQPRFKAVKSVRRLYR